MDGLLSGVYDLHVHTSPDVVPRKCDDMELARRLTAAGMGGCALKSHFSDTAARAALLRKQFPGLDVAGGVVLNRSAGGFNPEAVVRSAQMGGRLAWFPTMDSLAYQTCRNGGKAPANAARLLSTLDDHGKLLPAAVEVLEAAAEYHIVMGTGHIGAAEGMALVREAHRLGCRMVVTHADNCNDLYTLEQQQEAVRLGAMVEHCFFTTYYNRTPIEEIARQIRGVGCENVFLTTDFGQPKSPYSDEGISLYLHQLLEQGFTPAELDQMARQNPRSLLA